MAKRIVATLVVLALVAVAAVAGYQVGKGRWAMPFLPQSGTLRFRVQDGPGDVSWSHVSMTFTSIEAHRADAGNESGWVAVPFTSSRTVDLTTLNNVSQLLGQGSLTTGKYTEIRITIERIYGTMANGTKVDIGVPSGRVEINRPFNITANGTTVITVDIPLDHLHWGAGGWVLSPVVGSVAVEE